MSALMDIAKRRKSVDVNGQKVEVGGVSADDLFRLAERYPPLLELLQRRMPTVPDLMACGSGLIGGIIAAAFGSLGNDAEEKHAASLDLEVQLNLLIDIYGVTFPGGTGPFVQRVKEKFGIDLAADDQSSDETPTALSTSAPPARPKGTEAKAKAA